MEKKSSQGAKMKKVLTASLSVAAIASVAFAANSLDSNPNYKKLKTLSHKV
jgi:hypothetical protein